MRQTINPKSKINAILPARKNLHVSIIIAGTLSASARTRTSGINSGYPVRSHDNGQHGVRHHRHVINKGVRHHQKGANNQRRRGQDRHPGAKADSEYAGDENGKN